MKPRIGLVLGDPAGIGPELMAKLLSQPEVLERASILVVGDRRVLREGERVAGVEIPLDVTEDPETAAPGDERPVFLDLKTLDPAEVTIGEASATGGRSVLQNFGMALKLFQRGAVEAITFVPFNKQALRMAGNPYEDEMHFAAHELGYAGKHSEFNVLDNIWNARVTSHVPLRAVADLISKEAVLENIALTHQAMQEAGFERPRIAVAALNPHAGDGGAFGREDIDIIEPAVREAQARQFRVDGPFPSDTVFLRARDGHYDAVLTMYHDQGQIAIKMMGFDRGVTVLGGLPVPITTPAHGTAYDIAGQGKANLEPTRRAFFIACRMAEARRAPKAA